MLDAIILLTGAGEQSVLGARLRDCNPGLSIHPAVTLDELLAIDPVVLRTARLIGFATGVIVPRQILSSLGYGAYNFHPGPPSFPGLSPAQCAVYRRSSRFGVTVHRMVERVDAGPIVDVSLFDVPAGASVLELEHASYRELAHRFWCLSPVLASNAAPLPELPVRWSGSKSSRRTFATLCAIPADIARDELERRVAAFGPGYFGLAPTITLHGFRFQLVGEADEEPAILPVPERKQAS